MNKTYYRENFTEHYFWVDMPIAIAGAEPDLYIPRMGHFFGSGRFQRTYTLPYFAIHYCLHGPYRVTLDGHETMLATGDLILINKGREVQVCELADTPAENIWFDLWGKAVPDILDSVGLTPSNPVIRHLPMSEMIQLSERFKELAQSNSFTQSQTIMMAWQLMHLIETQTSTQSTSEHIPSAIKATILQRFKSGISISDLAKQFNMSRSTLFRVFRASYGLSPKQYLGDLRINYAVLLMQTSTLRLKEIAFSAGYETVQAFHFAFRKRYGTSPARWRKSGQR